MSGGGGRSILGGVDLNKNRKKAVNVTQYVNKIVIMLEVTGNDTMAVPLAHGFTFDNTI